MSAVRSGRLLMMKYVSWLQSGLPVLTLPA
mgnify:CR=1 FL=1